jgi:hypothetical protein
MGIEFKRAPMKYHLDGIQRNLVKLWDEGIKAFKAISNSMQRVFTNFDSHAIQDVFVETLRASPYFWGHVWLTYLVIQTVIWLI